MQSYKRLLLANKAWRQEVEHDNPNFLKSLKEEQRPHVLWIGCSDSRVPVETITGARPGELYVHRNVGNLISPEDPNSLSVIEYATSVLKVKNIIICGHYNCGGVHAALYPPATELSSLNTWIEPIRKVKVINKAPKKQDHVNQVAEASVIKQIESLQKLEIIQKTWKERKDLSLHGWVFNLNSGLVEELIQVQPD